MAKAKKMELLAPAGNIASALAAFDAGADAVYAGLKRFNARERTENFSLEEMSKLIGYARRIGRKVYVAFNTLVKESEIPDAAAMLSDLDSLRPDALIIQDLGVLRMAREFFPNLRLHASTQMGVHNSAGLRMAARLGITRVILERQVALDELEAMAQGSPVEIEVFIHGALCCCLSGSCLLSSWLGSWSGNRGKCKQPCRRRHFSKDGNGFFLSTKDLCALELLPEFARIGVASLKIEGRLRKSDYVTNAVSAYRMALDAPPESFAETLPKAKEILAKTCGRKWSSGFFTKESAASLVQHDSMGVAGMLCGKVASVSRNGFAVSVSKRLHVGDSIRVQPPSGDEGPAVTITKMSIDGAPAMKAQKGQTCFIHCDKETPAGGFVYKIGESTDEMLSRIESLPPLRTALDLSIGISLTKVSVAILSLPSSPAWEKGVEFQSADKRPVAAETISNEFAASASGIFSARRVECSVEGSPFIPASVLKGLRREFWSWVEANVSPDAQEKASKGRLQSFMSSYEAMRGARPPAKSSALLPPKAKPPERDCIVIRELDANPRKGEETLLPFFVTEAELPRLKKSIVGLIAAGVKIFRASSLLHFEILSQLEGVEMKVCIPLPVCNSLAAAELLALGATQATAWIELEKSELERLAAKSPLPLETYRYGRPPLLATRAAIPVEGHISDARGNKFTVMKKGVLTFVLPERPMSVPEVEGASSLFDFRHARPDEQETSKFNFLHTLA